MTIPCDKCGQRIETENVKTSGPLFLHERCVPPPRKRKERNPDLDRAAMLVPGKKPLAPLPLAKPKARKP